MKLSLKPATKGKYHHSYDVSSIFSLDLGEILPSRIIPVVPSDDITHVHGESTIRLAPLVFPPYGKAYIKTATFYVPQYQLIEYADALRQDMSSFRGKSIKMPYFSASDINYMFSLQSSIGSSNGLSTLVLDSSNPVTNRPNDDQYDFCYFHLVGTTLTYSFYKLTTLGKHYYKIIKMLGYDFASYGFKSTYTSADASIISDTANTPVNALKLLAYAKVYVDMFLNGVFYNTNTLVALLRAIHDNETYSSEYNASSGLLSVSGIWHILSNIFLPHESCMYTLAWNSPNSPDGLSPALNSGFANNLMSPYITSSQNAPNALWSDNLDNSLYNAQSNYLREINQNGLKILKAFDSFVRRFGISGSKAVQKVYSAFGVKSDDFNSNFVHKLHEGASKIPFTPVLSNADTISGSNGKPIGSYAGFGASGLDIDFDYKCNDFGYLITVNWIQFVPILLHGFDPENLKLHAFDFFTPEYDGQAFRAIPQMEVSINKTSTDDPDKNGDQKIFGYTNIYDEYRELKDVVAGDFVNGLAKNFLFCRDLGVYRRGSASMKAQTDMVHYYGLGGQYNDDMSDPFQMSPSNGDRFYVQIDWSIEANRPIQSYSASMDLGGEGELSLSKNGDMIQ